MVNFKYSPELYDLQVNWEARLDKEIGFLKGIIRSRGVKSILDIGCGTAHHLQALSPYADKLVGLDPLEETIDYARREVASAANIRLEVGGFEDINNMNLGEFDLVMSLGNTLPLLKSRRKVKLALKHCRKILVKGGTALFQFLNFDRKMIEANHYYPPKTAKYRGRLFMFLKHFEYGRLNTRLDLIITELDSDGKAANFEHSSSYLCTLKQGMFLKMSRNAGYKKIKALGPDGENAFNAKKDISLYAILNS